MTSPTLQRLALLRLSALGDVTLVVPVVRAIQRQHPKLNITWIIDRSAYALVEGLSDVNFMVINKPNSLKSYWQLRNQLKHHRFDMLLAMQASFRANILYPLIKAPIKIGFDKKRSRDGHGFFINRHIAPQQEHLLEGFMRFASALGVNDLSLSWDLPIEHPHWAWAKQQLAIQPNGCWIAINPAASKVERLWMVERYATVIREAKKRWKVNILLTGGPNEFEKNLAEKIIEKS